VIKKLLLTLLLITLAAVPLQTASAVIESESQTELYLFDGNSTGYEFNPNNPGVDINLESYTEDEIKQLTIYSKILVLLFVPLVIEIIVGFAVMISKLTQVLLIGSLLNIAMQSIIQGWIYFIGKGMGIVFVLLFAGVVYLKYSIYKKRLTVICGAKKIKSFVTVSSIVEFIYFILIFS